MVDNAMFYLIGTLLSAARARDLPDARLPAVRRARSATSEADDDMKAKAQKDAEAALADPLEAFHGSSSTGSTFIGGDSPSIADIRLGATLEFLRAIDYEFPAWTEDYMQRVEEALGDAYSEPAADVRGFVQSVKAPE